MHAHTHTLIEAHIDRGTHRQIFSKTDTLRQTHSFTDTNTDRGNH